MTVSFNFTIEGNDASPIITPVKPVDGEVGVSPAEPIRVKLEHETGINMATLTVSVNGVYYILNGEVAAGARFSFSLDGSPIVVGSVESSTIINFTLTLPAPYPSPGIQTVVVSVENLDQPGGGGGGGGV